MGDSKNFRFVGLTIVVALILSVALTQVSWAESIYVSNGGDGTIKVVSLTGAVCTFASGLSTPRGLAFDSSGNLFVANDGDGTLLKINPAGQVSTFATGISTGSYGVAVIGGNIYVAQSDIGDILRFTPTGDVSTFVPDISYPGGIVPDGLGGMFVTISVSGAISGGINHIDSAGNVSLYATGIQDPIGLVRDPVSGEMFAAEFMDSYGPVKVVRIDTDGSVHDLAITGVGTPYGLVLANGYVYAADFAGGAINKIDSSGNVTSFVTGLSSPRFMTLGPDVQVPEPATLALLSMGVLGVFGYVRRQRMK